LRKNIYQKKFLKIGPNIPFGLHDFNSGAIIATGRDLDVALCKATAGLTVHHAQDWHEGITRNGALQILNKMYKLAETPAVAAKTSMG